MTTSVLTNDGILNNTLDTLTVESLGSGVSEVVVEDILTGSVSDIIVEDVGQQYEVGDTITFTSDSNDTDISSVPQVKLVWLVVVYFKRQEHLMILILQQM